MQAQHNLKKDMCQDMPPPPPSSFLLLPPLLLLSFSSSGGAARAGAAAALPWTRACDVCVCAVCVGPLGREVKSPPLSSAPDLALDKVFLIF